MPSASKTTLWAGAALSIFWLAVNCALASRLNLASSDSILYSLPLAVAKKPFDLGFSFLGDFVGFGKSRGHHWPGAMWPRGLVLWPAGVHRTKYDIRWWTLPIASPRETH